MKSIIENFRANPPSSVTRTPRLTSTQQVDAEKTIREDMKPRENISTNESQDMRFLIKSTPSPTSEKDKLLIVKI